MSAAARRPGGREHDQVSRFASRRDARPGAPRGGPFPVGVAGSPPQRVALAGPFHLARTLQSGQCFRWQVEADTGRGVVGGTVVRVRQRAGGLEVRWDGPPGRVEALIHHLGADAPLAEIERRLAADPVLRRLLPRTSGVAIMRQDPWECLISYVISAFNNIPKISLSVQRLARCLGEPIYAGRAGSIPPGAGRAAPIAWAFPGPERLAQAPASVLRGCALGYRAAYVRAIARRVADGELDLARVGALPHAQARAALLDLPGVGEKVADCVLLFGYGHGDAFPVDVWVQRAVEHWYFDGRAASPAAVRAWARDRFGPLAGYAQQHLFVGARTS